MYNFFVFYLQNELSSYSDLITYECLPCAEGCESCRDASPCIAALNWTMRTSILILACAVIGFLPPAAWFTFRYQQVKVLINNSKNIHSSNESNRIRFNI